MREGGECRKRGALEVSGGGTGTPWGCGDMGSGGAGGGGGPHGGGWRGICATSTLARCSKLLDGGLQGLRIGRM